MAGSAVLLSLPKHVPCLLELLSSGGIQCFQVRHQNKNPSWGLAVPMFPTSPRVPELQEPGHSSTPELFSGVQEEQISLGRQILC